MAELEAEVALIDAEHAVHPKLRSFVCGAASGVSKLVIGHPFDTLKVRMQVEGGYGRFKGPLDCLKTTARTEGIRGLYKGATPPLFGWTLIDTIMFGTYGNTRMYIQSHLPANEELKFRHNMLAGFTAGMVCSVVVCPIEQIKARLQVQYADPSSIQYKGPIDCVRKLVHNNGVAGLYHGFAATLLYRSFISIYFASYEYYKTMFAGSGPLQNFACGGLAATTLWTFAFPFDVVKNRMMAQPDVPDRPYKTVADCFRKIYAKEGLKGFWRGFTPCLLRSFPANGVAFSVVELLHKHLP
eukprot:GILK01004807.1.p1 GENE.GILK01004807.1~~GILK01004807.1.p1  ORF type:complete len:308 (+),score=38.14 GILK01004807.1:32-925(+)